MEYCNQRHEIVLSDITVTELLNHFLCFFKQITLDRANCLLLAVLSQVKGVPKDYSVTYLRRWMAIHLAKNVDYLWVKFFTYSIHLYTGIFLGKSI